MPAPRVRLHPDAERDLQEGLDFYLERSSSVAERFLLDAEAALNLIAEAPDRWPTATAGARRYVMAAFPYSIVYRVTPAAIQVLAVAHAKRRPTYWKRRRF